MPVSIFRLRRRSGPGPFSGLLGAPAAFLLLVVALLAGIWSYLAGEANRAETARGNAVITGVERLLSAVKDLETGERGYVLVGGEEYLEPYTRALQAIDAGLSGLGQAVQEPLRPGGPVLARLIAEKRAFAARVVAERREAGFEPATAIVRTGITRCPRRPGT